MNLLFGLAALFFILAAIFESTFTLWLQKLNQEPTIAQINQVFEQSIFEGEALGASDIGIFGLIFSLVVYLFSKSHSLKSAAAFFFQFGIFTAITLVHGPKWAIGRARPHRVLDGIADYSYWFEPGREFFLTTAEGAFRSYSGSFPSGHTASLAALFAGCWFLIDFKSRKKVVTLGYFLTIGLFGLCVMMGLTRVSLKAHWPTDTMASLLGIAFASYIFYQHVYFLPLRKSKPKTDQMLGFGWQFQLLIWLLGSALLFWTSVLIWRHEFVYSGFGLTFSKYSFLLLALICCIRAKNYRKNIYQNFYYKDGTSPHLLKD